MADLDKTFSSHFTRKQSSIREKSNLAFKATLEKQGKPGPITGLIADKLPEKLASLKDSMYDKRAMRRDAVEIQNLTSEIDARLSAGSSGVLIRRITIMHTGDAGTTIPIYAGLQVAGDGENELDALSKYNNIKSGIEGGSRNQEALGAVCTPQNPTGERLKAEQTIQALPSGFNLGYASSLSNVIYKSLETNPKNIGKIEIGGQVSPLQPTSFIEDSFFFISKEEWVQRKDSTSNTMP
jgi:hypothetical protein